MRTRVAIAFTGLVVALTVSLPATAQEPALEKLKQMQVSGVDANFQPVRKPGKTPMRSEKT